MAYKSGSKGRSRDFGLNHGSAGKGSASRTVPTESYRKNFDEWHSALSPAIEGFVRTGHKSVKHYPL